MSEHDPFSSPAKAPVAAREAETSEAEGEQGERSGFGHGSSRCQAGVLAESSVSQECSRAADRTDGIEVRIDRGVEFSVWGERQSGKVNAGDSGRTDQCLGAIRSDRIQGGLARSCWRLG